MQIQFLADRPEVTPVIAQWYFEEWGRKNPENSVAAIHRRLRRETSREILPLQIIAIGEDGALLGTAQLKLREMTIFPERKFWLGGVYVSRQVRGRGIGAALVNRVIELAQRRAIPELWLQTYAEDGGLYARLGWVITDHLLYKDEEVTVMVRKINDGAP
ncbi:MAG: GNAT family N-acetyltransferase [Caldilineaceae bacterium]|nr:GNAT family N-acetyltransferase [Caldilineaceae bacterium]